MMYLDFALRGGAIALLLVMALLVWRAPFGWESRASVVALALSKSAFMIIAAPLAPEMPALALANLALLAAFTPLAITWFIINIFLDGPALRWPWLAGAAATSALFYVDLISPETLILCAAAGMVLYGALAGLALWTARDDLVECRYRARPVFAVSIAGLAFVLTGAQVLGLVDQRSMALALMQSVGTFGLTVAFALWLLRPVVEKWPGETHPEPAVPNAAAAHEGADPVLIGRITSAMSAGIWREEGLTIGALASKLSVPEHRLRRAINQGLGHRNFSSFINRARIEAACAQLRDPKHLHRTVLEIAYDVGFASLGPFNRAFRAEMGCSPTEYRRDAPVGKLADSEKMASIPANLH